MKKLYFFILMVFVFNNINAQLYWQKTYGGTDHEYACKTIKTTDGGYAFVGFSKSNDGDVSSNHGENDLWVAKTNSAGTIVWSKLYGGTSDEQGYDIIQTSDGGFMVAGWADSNDGDVTGHHGANYYSDFWVLKLNSAGTLIWNKCYGGTNDDEGKAIAMTTSEEFYIAGTTYSNDGDVSGNHGTGYNDFWAIKISNTGTLLYQKCVGGTNTDEGINMYLTSDQGCVLTGRTYSNDGDVTGYNSGSDMLIAKLNSTLQIDWVKCYGGSGTEEGNAIVQLTDGTYSVLGYTSSHNNGNITGHHGSQGTDDFWLLKLNTDGTLNWAKCYGGDNDDQANGLTRTSDGGFVMCGLTASNNGDVSGFHTGSFFDPDIWVARVNSSGVLLGQRCCGGSGQDESFNVFEESANLFVVTGFTYSTNFDVTLNHGSADGWILKVNPVMGITEHEADFNLTIYPNPATDKLYINTDITINKKTVEVFDINSKLLQSIEINEANTELNVSLFKSGVYVIKINSQKQSVYTKFVKL
ncbi:MAG: T9SS type A sorting domain-containing protein [Bacteroidia bacterium]|nr:T9SS type A sorting domain-containing protein [Bacteroidia bacterium]